LKVGKLLNRCGLENFGVSDLAEGILLRKAGIKKTILLFESTLPQLAGRIITNNLIPTVCTLELAKALNRTAAKAHKKINIHIEIDTGMGRLGVWHKEAINFIKEIYPLKNLNIHGLYTHFPVAETDKSFTLSQVIKLSTLVKKLDQQGLVIPFIHAANSMGLAGYKTHVLNLARPGLMVYGLYPHRNLKKRIKLKPAMSVGSTVIYLKEVGKGRSISYGRTFIAKDNMKVATIPIGYNDGYLRQFSNKASVVIEGVRCPVVGRVTMDQIIVDVSKVKNVRIGSLVTILGKQKSKEISADELAGYADTINYEIVCALGNRLPRKYKV